MGAADGLDVIRIRCPVCKGSGEDVALSLELGKDTPNGYLPMKCAKCRGIGRIPESEVAASRSSSTRLA
jgi:phage FluMu protein Com